MATGVVYHPDCLLHDTGAHPETSGRLLAILAYLEKTGLRERLTFHEPGPAQEEALLWCHTNRHVETVRQACEKGGRAYLDPDTPVVPESWQAALLAAGGVMDGLGRIMSGEWVNGMALVRPPGHHATPVRPMGFCLFNNVAIGARYLQKRHGLRRVAIIDWDVHHGNGTQDIFYDDPSVFYLSTHLAHHYPGTGRADETGSGDGRGATHNIPLPHGCDTATFFREIEAGFRLVTAFNPEFILISAGFDSHRDDPLGGLSLTEADFARLTRMIMEIADSCCGGRVFSALEGGYNLSALSHSVAAHLEALAC
ncbi:MAG: histone deacetylase [Nitrospirota bacterium]|nr:histone deacetylase [Nitrospirota bacterium]